MLTADVLNGFAGSVLSARFDDPKPTPDFHKELWELCCSDARYVAIAAPRSHAKSTSVTHSYVLANVLFRQRSFVVIVSDTEGQAVDFLGDIKVELEENDDLKQLFGIRKIITDTQTNIIVGMKDGHKFRIVAKGSEQKVRGLKWHGKRPDLIVGDDLENDEIVLNQDRRTKFKKWVHGALLPCLADQGIARFVGTILHLDSFLEGHMPDEKDPDCVKTPLCTKLYKPGALWASARYRAHSEDFKHILWPEKFDRKRLEGIRADFAKRGFPEVYAQEYLNYPIDEGTAYFRKEDFLPIKESERFVRRKYYAAIDFAISQKEHADFTVIAVAGMDLDGYLHIVDIRRGRWDSLEIINEMFSVQQRYEPELFTAESGSIEKALGPFLKAEMLKRGVYLNLNPMNPTKDKPTRARAIQARMRAGGVKFDTSADWFPELQSEMLRFPKDVHDDQVDAVAWIGLTLDQLIEPPSDKEVEDEYYAELERDEPQGRNYLTGY